MVLRIIKEELRIGAGHSIECSTLESANWKLKDEAVQSAFIIPEKSRPTLFKWSKCRKLDMKLYQERKPTSRRSEGTMVEMSERTGKDSMRRIGK